MGRDLRQEALTYLLEIAEKQGYVTFDEIMNCADEKSLPIQDFDWLSSAVTTRGIIVYDEAPVVSNRIGNDSEENDYNDYAQSDYEHVYDRIIELDESLKDFITEVRNIKPPQWREFNQLKYQALEGNQHARKRMIEMHLRIALRIALQRTETYDIDIQDAIGDACLGLITAVDKYNPDVNGAFGSYAAMWVLQSISRRQPTQRPLMYYPVHKKESYFLAYPILKNRGCIDYVDTSEMRAVLAEKLDFSEEQIEDTIQASIPFCSFEEKYDAIINEDFLSEDSEGVSTKYPLELICDESVEEKISSQMLKIQIMDVLDSLTDREKMVIILRYGINRNAPMTLEEVGMAFDVTRERIRQIEAKALRKLAHPSRTSKLKDFRE